MNNTAETTIPVGEYVVGDPCYAIPEDRWMEWLEAADFRSDPLILAAELDGLMCIGVNTAHGDGVYYDQHGREYGVDAGMIGLVPVQLVPNLREDEVVTVFIDRPTPAGLAEDGTIYLGDIRIPTDYEDEDEDYENYDDEL